MPDLMSFELSDTVFTKRSDLRSFLFYFEVIKIMFIFVKIF